MKSKNLVCLALLSVGSVCHAQETKTGIVYEIPLEEMLVNSDPASWSTAPHYITYTDGQINLGTFDSTFAVGLGLWFGLHDEEGNMLATCIVGPQPTAEFSLVSKDIDSNDTTKFTEPMTRVDVPFSVSATISTVSDDAYLQTLAIAQVNNDYYSAGQVLQYPNASKCMMFTRHLSEEQDDGTDLETLIDRIYTYGDGEIVLKDIDNVNYDPNLDNSVIEVSSGFMPLNPSETVTTTAEEDSRVVPVTTTLTGKELFTPHVVTSLSWATDQNGVPLSKESINFNSTDFTEGDGVAMRILPTAWAMLPRDGSGRVIGGETYYTLPSIRWAAKNLYPRSQNQIAIFVGTNTSGTPLATSDPDGHTVSEELEVQDMDIFWDLTLDQTVVDQDNVTYTAALRTKTPIDFDGDGSLDDEGWEVIDTVSFFYNREVNVNGVIVTGE
jgi:hypothetical protein